jgi:hypothetical protein
MKALPSFVTYLRAVLRIQRMPVPGSMSEVIKAGLRVVNADASAFLAALEARRSRKAPRLGLQDAVVSGYYGAAEATVAFVDQLREV